MAPFKRRSNDVVDEHINSAFSALVEQPPRRRSLRCSGLPYCPILDTVLPDEPELGNLEGALFTGMGTAAHESIQFFMALGKLGKCVWGSWECVQCKRKLTHCFRPPDCCGNPMKYVEIDFRIGPMTGHVDMIARYGNKWIVYEFKTIGREPRKPKRVHLLQVRHYVALLKIQFKIDVHAYTVVYVGRQHLERWKFGPFDAKGSLQQTRNWVFRAISGYKAATQARKDPTRENLKEVVRHRPCKSREDWTSYMSRGYRFNDGKQECPMLPHCTRGDRAALQAVEQMINGDAE